MTTAKLLNDDDINKENGNLVFNPFNNNNIEITEASILNVLNEYNIPKKIYNIELYKRAFIHKSYIKRPHLENVKNNIIIEERPHDCLPLKTKCNERLEFLGDGILECITKYYLYKRFPKENEGFMTEKKIAIVKNESIGKFALEMGLHKWLIISKHAEEKKTRTNLKKLGCLFEAFIGALFLDYNHISIKDEDKWFDNVFSTGPGFQIAQIFVESVLEKHVDWTELINTDDNYKNILQVKIQKEFKTTPHYVEIDVDAETGYNMGVYICLGQQIHEVDITNAIDYNEFKSFEKIQNYIEEHNKVLVFLSNSRHKIKKKAEQEACDIALKLINKD